MFPFPLFIQVFRVSWIYFCKTFNNLSFYSLFQLLHRYPMSLKLFTILIYLFFYIISRIPWCCIWWLTMSLDVSLFPDAVCDNCLCPSTCLPFQVSTATSRPWYRDVLNASEFQERSVPGSIGWWTYPYFQCKTKHWLLSYTAPLQPRGSSSRGSGIRSVEHQG